MLGSHLFKTWSTTQNTIALSLGEAEYYGIVKGASVMLGMISPAGDLGLDLGGRMWTDSSPGRAIASRRGLGKVRHIHTTYLWVQERVATKAFSLHKVKGTENPADLMTKHLDSANIDNYMRKLGYCEQRPRCDQQLTTTKA